MYKLKEGNKKFREEKFNRELAEYLADNGQFPKTLFITCSDSRVVPSALTGSKKGELFIERNIGNFIAPYTPEPKDYRTTSAVIEYALEILGVNKIIVCGHTECGSIAKLFADVHETDTNRDLIKWLELGQPAKEKVIKLHPDAKLRELKQLTEKESVRLQMANLKTYPQVQKAIEDGSLKVYGWLYNIRTGEVEYLDSKDGEFKPLDEYEED